MAEYVLLILVYLPAGCQMRKPIRNALWGERIALVNTPLFMAVCIFLFHVWMQHIESKT
jgi:hypothetical protein